MRIKTGMPYIQTANYDMLKIDMAVHNTKKNDVEILNNQMK